MVNFQWGHVKEVLYGKLELQEQISKKVIDKIRWIPKLEESQWK